MRAHRTFRSKVDRWLGWTFGLSFMVMIVGAGQMITAAVLVGDLVSGGIMTIAALVLITGAGLMAWTLGSTFYTFEHDSLSIRSGPFAWRFPVKQITGAQPMRNPASGPALSLDRLALALSDGRTMMISPLDKEGFLAELEARKAA